MFVADWSVNLCSSSFHNPKPTAPHTHIQTTKFLPYFTHTQAKLLLRLINHMQQQILTQRPISIPYTLLNSTPTSNDLIAKLPTLRYFANNTSFPLFNTEKWQENELLITPSSLGSELLLGFYEPYNDWLRGNYLRSPQLGNAMLHAPLHVWKPLWLDARGDEQMLYLYLEAIAQDHRLDAKMLAHSISSAKCIHSLGRKLVEHGYLATPPLTLTNDIDWLPSRGIERQTLRDEYLRNVCLHYAKTVMPDVAKTLVTRLTQSSPSAQSLCQEFISICAEANEHVNCVTMLSPAAPLSNLTLFFDWTIRSHLPNFPLPESLSSSELQKITTSSTSLRQRYVDFSAYLQQQKKLVMDMLALPNACLVNMPAASATPAAAPEVRSSVALLPTQKRLKKIAGIELSKIKTRSRTEYLQLEQQYIDSLDAEAKESVLGIKKYMQASVFEKQLRPRIISFMIENPSVWNRTEAIKALQVFDSN